MIDKQVYLIKQAFYHLNGFKRFRALEQQDRERNNDAGASRNELSMYKSIDQLELVLRGLQSELKSKEADEGD